MRTPNLQGAPIGKTESCAALGGADWMRRRVPSHVHAAAVAVLLTACASPPDGADAGARDVARAMDAGIDAGPPPLDPIEYTASAPMFGPDGTVVAHGWAREAVFEYDRALVRADLAEQVREWEYFDIFTPDFQADVTLTDIGLLTGAFLTVRDLATGETVRDSMLAGAGTLTLPSTPFESTHFVSPGGEVDLAYAPSGERTVHYAGGTSPAWERAEVDLTITDDPAGESIATLVCFPPLDPGLFFYENKRLALPVTGTIRIGTRTWTVPVGSFVVIDWGRGAWPSDVSWLWADAAGTTADGRRVGINLGTVHGDDSRGTSDAVVVDGVLSKMGRVSWTFDADAPMSPWTFEASDGRLSLTLTPDFDASSELGSGARSQRVVRVLGTYSGSVELDDGTTLAIEGIRGAAEEVTIRW